MVIIFPCYRELWIINLGDIFVNRLKHGEIPGIQKMFIEEFVSSKPWPPGPAKLMISEITLWQTNIVIGNGPLLYMIYPLNMVIFHSYVSIC